MFEDDSWDLKGDFKAACDDDDGVIWSTIGTGLVLNILVVCLYYYIILIY